MNRLREILERHLTQYRSYARLCDTSNSLEAKLKESDDKRSSLQAGLYAVVDAIQVRLANVPKDELIECEFCGCLVYKVKKNMFAKTIEQREKPTASGSVHFPVFLKVQEDYIEYHYACARCRKEVEVTDE